MKTDKLEGYDYFSSGVLACCEQCQSDYGMTAEEIENNPPANDPSIGYNCDGCDSSLMRDDIYSCHARDNKTNEIVHLELCSDCMLKYCS